MYGPHAVYSWHLGLKQLYTFYDIKYSLKLTIEYSQIVCLLIYTLKMSEHVIVVST